MPSTYSNIKIQLMATGENNTTWGNVTNINLGTALEEAIVGSADVTFASGNVTLTLTDTNASQTARHVRLRCTGVTGGSTRDLIVPAIEKPYLVQNDCLNSIVVKNATGTGITVPAGKTMWVYNDGTNVVDAVNHLSSLTLGTALPVGQGGTGASTFTANGIIYGNTTSALLATAAGTTGQVLVGNTGGAPSWATLTGIGVTSFSGGTTGLTPASPTTGAITLAGTLGVANGGTGTATQFTAGSVVFAGASGVYSQDNANLFWDNTNNYLGVGTATPSAPFHVKLTTDRNARFLNAYSSVAIGSTTDVGAEAPLAFFANPITFVTNNIERMRIDASGNVGVATSAPTALLTVNGTAKVGEGVATNTSKFMVNTLSGVAAGIQLIQDANESWIIQNPASSTVLTFSASGNERMRITSAGFVGIGTSSPGTRLDVSGGDVYRSFQVTTATGGLIEMGLLGQSIIGIQSLTNLSNFQSLILNPNGGNVGIGTTTPASKLEVTGDITQTWAAAMDRFVGSKFSTTYELGLHFLEATRETRIVSKAADSSGLVSIYTGVTPTERMRIDSSGNVGIGTNNPTVPLDVFNSSGGWIRFRNNSGEGELFADGAAALLGSVNAIPLLLRTGSVERMRITVGGNVGIGTTTPGAPLEVSSTTDEILRITSTGNPYASWFAGVTRRGYIQAQSTAFTVASDTAIPLIFSTNTVERMRIDSAGLVGIGTSGQPIRGNLDISLGGLTTAGLERSIHFGYSSADFYGFKLSNINSPGSFAAGTFSIQRGTTAAWVDALLINDVGNVGIGTSTPSAKLDVNGTGYFSDNVSIVRTNTAGSLTGLTINNAGTTAAYAGVQVSSGTVTSQFFNDANGNAVVAGAILRTTTNHPFVFGTNATERMRISAAGLVGIGTSNPLSPLVLSNGSGENIEFTPGSSTLNGGVIEYINRSAFPTTRPDLNYYIGVPGAHKFYTDTFERMRIDSTGFVGIGTSTPGSLLELSADLGPTINLRRSGSANGNGIICSIGNTGTINAQITLGGGVSNHMTFAVNGSERARITSSGDVGIGTTSPLGKFSVNGSGSTQVGFNANLTGTPERGNLWYDTDNSGWKFYIGKLAGGTFSAQMAFQDNGNVGIGTTSPTDRLTVVSSDIYQFAFKNSSASSTGALGYDSTNNMLFNANGAERARIDSSGNLVVGKTVVTDTIAGFYVLGNPSSSQLGAVSSVLAGTTSGNQTMLVYSTGASAYRFYVDMAGTVYATSTTIAAISDQRLKENVRDLDTGLDTILALKPRRFDWKAGKGKDVRDDMGFIAQEVETVLPELIGGWKAGEGEPDDLKSVKAGDLIPVLVKAIQELTARVAQLEGK